MRELAPEFWVKWLPLLREPEEANRVLDMVYNGVSIGRPAATSIVVSPNWPSANELAVQVDAVVRADLEAGKLMGPFREPPFDSYILSPLGAFVKRDKSKIRLIHDLSYPHGQSVNDLIDAEEYSLQYESVDSAVRACRVYSFPYLSKIDLQDAYKAIAVRPEDWHLLGFSWGLPGGESHIYFSKVLSFGLRSAPALFDVFAQVVQEATIASGVNSKLIRYVDDFLLVSPDIQVASEHLEKLTNVAREAGFRIQPSKVVAPTRCTEFLGIVIDLPHGILRISSERMSEILDLLDRWHEAKVISKRNLLKLVGKLAFAARVVRTGRAFLGRLIGLAKGTKPLHHRIKLSLAARQDIAWWIACIKTHNGTTILDVDWSAGDIIHMFTDASDHGSGGVCDGEWWATVYAGSASFPRSRSINWRELHAAVVALATWSPHIPGAKVMLHIDNSAACHILNKLYTPVPELMELVRQWALLVEKYSISTSIVYIPTLENTMADALSRGEIDKFKAVHGGNPSRVWPTKIQYFEQMV